MCGPAAPGAERYGSLPGAFGYGVVSEPGLGREVAVHDADARIRIIHLDERPVMASALTLHADDLLQGMNHIDQVLLGRHDGVDILVSARRLINHLGVFAAFHTIGCAYVVLD